MTKCEELEQVVADGGVLATDLGGLTDRSGRKLEIEMAVWQPLPDDGGDGALDGHRHSSGASGGSNLVASSHVTVAGDGRGAQPHRRLGRDMAELSCADDASLEAVYAAAC